jgi:hypothetical protein
MKRMLGWLKVMCLMCLMCTVVACSDPDQGPPLGAFAAITKTETDAPFNIVPPSSKSPADFNYTSSNPAVAVISGSLVTIKGPGTSTITAAQPGVGGWGPTSASTTLTVTAVPCGGTDVRINGVCTPVPNCIKPATLTNNQCIPQANTAQLVHATGLAWTGVYHSDNWTNARDYCSTITVGNTTGWKLPTAQQLLELQASGALAGQGWLVGPTWSADMGTNSNTAAHVVVDLSSGGTLERNDVGGAYVTCVR